MQTNNAPQSPWAVCSCCCQQACRSKVSGPLSHGCLPRSALHSNWDVAGVAACEWRRGHFVP
jgi:hypothetical protein